jgi:hypothetical protein
MSTNYLLSNDPNEQNRVYTNYGFDPRGNNEMGTMFHKYGAALHPETAREVQWLVDYLGPQSRALVERLVSSLNDPQAMEAETRGFANKAYEDAGRGSSLLGMQLRSQGYGDGALGGATQGFYQDAARSTNQYRQQQMSPQAKLQRLMASLSGMQNVGMPGLQTQQSLFGPIEERHRQNRSEAGSGSLLGGVLGTLGGLTGIARDWKELNKNK